MARFEIRVRPSVSKDLQRIPASDVRRILARIEALGEDPRPSGAEKLTGSERFRVRQGNYRILYSVLDDVLIVDVVKAGHRRDVYR